MTGRPVKGFVEMQGTTQDAEASTVPVAVKGAGWACPFDGAQMLQTNAAADGSRQFACVGDAGHVWVRTVGGRQHRGVALPQRLAADVAVSAPGTSLGSFNRSPNYIAAADPRPAGPPCVDGTPAHHWLIEATPDGGVYGATCRRCPEVRGFEPPNLNADYGNATATVNSELVQWDTPRHARPVPVARPDRSIRADEWRADQ